MDRGGGKVTWNEGAWLLSLVACGWEPRWFFFQTWWMCSEELLRRSMVLLLLKVCFFFFLLCFYSSSFSLSLIFSFVSFILSLFSASASLFPLSFFPPLFSPVSFSLSLYPLCSSFDFSSQSPSVWVSLFLRYPVNSPLFCWFPPLSVSVFIVFSSPSLFCSVFSSLSHLPPPFSFLFPFCSSPFSKQIPLYFSTL